MTYIIIRLCCSRTGALLKWSNVILIRIVVVCEIVDTQCLIFDFFLRNWSCWYFREGVFIRCDCCAKLYL